MACKLTSMQVNRSTGQVLKSITLDRSQGSPALYVQVVRELENLISAGIIEPGQLLPSEPVLTAQLGVSRATVTKALGVLASAGSIDRRQGQGTFVRDSPMQNSLTEITSFSSITRKAGAVPSHRLLNYDVIAEARERGGLAKEFPAGEALLHIERVRLIDDKAVGHHNLAIPMSLSSRAKLTQKRVSVASFSLYKEFARIGETPHSIEESLQAVACPVNVAKHLGVEPGEPMMRVDRLTKNRFGKIIEVVESHYVGDLYKYYSDISITSPGRAENENIQTHDMRGSRDVRIDFGERLRRASAG